LISEQAGLHSRWVQFRLWRATDNTLRRIDKHQGKMIGTDQMTDDTEIAWHRELIAKNRTILEELEAGNTAGSDVFPETQSEIEHLKAQIAQSELIVAASEKI
jgi:hypothetical protein